MKHSVDYGFLFFLCVLLLSPLHAVNISLELHDNGQGSRESTVVVGQLFDVAVVITGKDGVDTDDIKLTIGNNVRVRGVESSVQATFGNGKLSKTFTKLFRLQAHKEGPLTIGPASMEHNGNKITSNILQLTVVQQMPEETSQKSAAAHDQQLIACHLIPQKKEVFIGEPFVVRVVIATHVQILQMALAQPQFEHFVFKEAADTQSYKKTYNNIPYDVVEKRFILTPTTKGTLAIEPIQLSYATIARRKKNKQHFFGDAFFGGFLDQDRIIQKTISSNSAQVVVHDLPPEAENVDVVGVINSCVARVDKKEVMYNQAVSFFLEVEGTGNIEQLPAPKISLPSYAKYYESKASFKPDSSNPLKGKKIFEYIIQCAHEGDVEIPAQSFSYFDTEKKEVASIATAPVFLHILPPPLVDKEQQCQVIQPDHHEQKSIDLAESQENSVHKDVCFIQEDGPIMQKEVNGISWLIFLFLLLMAPLIFTGTWMWDRLMRVMASSDFVQKGSQRKAIDSLRKEFTLLEQKGNPEKLYQLFIRLIAVNGSVDQRNVTHEWLYEYLISLAWQEVKINEFFDFLNECAQLRFVSQAHSSVVVKHEELFKKASYWLVLLTK
ncbi:MAG: hypothetical protein US69_C0002G0022 [candidate division TM6 bacterium GW2011_GWF2_38_10]|nr:MAG: hypothetical protein US69_C0002G0022 [candidate division TM6 bacterium GW2011_GWF2_38_10]